MSEFQLIETIVCSDAQDFWTHISPIGPLFGHYSATDAWIFRGVGSADYKLQPTAFREEGRRRLYRMVGLDRPLDTDLNPLQWLAEASAVEQFFRCADEAGLPFPEDSQLTRQDLSTLLSKSLDWLQALIKENQPIQGIMFQNAWEHWIPTSLLSFVAIAQHYGIPTRLLDWTYSPFVACYFAARDAISKQQGQFCVYALLVRQPETVPNLWSIFSPKQLRFSIVTAPRAANPNLHAQQGVFTYLEKTSGYFPDCEWKSLAIDDELAGTFNPCAGSSFLIFKITVESKHAAEVLWYLNKFGYNAARLFPGFAGAARALDEHHELRPPETSEQDHDS